jgi:hypothetical protein
MVLPPGAVVLSPADAALCATALEVVTQLARRDGVEPRARVGELLDLLRAATAQVASDAGVSASVTSERGGAGSVLLDPVPALEAAKMLGCTAHNVRDLCRRGGFASARRLGGSWLVERDEVTAEVARRAVERRSA